MQDKTIAVTVRTYDRATRTAHRVTVFSGEGLVTGAHSFFVANLKPEQLHAKATQLLGRIVAGTHK